MALTLSTGFTDAGDVACAISRTLFFSPAVDALWTISEHHCRLALFELASVLQPLACQPCSFAAYIASLAPYKQQQLHAGDA